MKRKRLYRSPRIVSHNQLWITYKKKAAATGRFWKETISGNYFGGWVVLPDWLELLAAEFFLLFDLAPE